MKIKKDFILKETAGNNIVVGVGKSGAKLNGIINLNSSGAFIWKLIEKSNLSENEIINALVKKYNITEEIAKKALGIFVEKATELGVIDV